MAKLEQSIVMEAWDSVCKGVVERVGGQRMAGAMQHDENLKQDAVDIPDRTDGENKRQQRQRQKAFTGTGNLRAVRRASAVVEALRDEMRALIELTLTVGDHRRMSLSMHTRAQTGQFGLRWRTVGTKTRHLSWDEADEIAASWGPEWAAWYGQVTNTALVLNEREMEARQQLRKERARAGLTGIGTPNDTIPADTDEEQGNDSTE